MAKWWKLFWCLSLLKVWLLKQNRLKKTRVKKRSNNLCYIRLPPTQNLERSICILSSLRCVCERVRQFVLNKQNDAKNTTWKQTKNEIYSFHFRRKFENSLRNLAQRQQPYFMRILNKWSNLSPENLNIEHEGKRTWKKSSNKPNPYAKSDGFVCSMINFNKSPHKTTTTPKY